MAFNVFNGDGGVVDENADCQGQSAQSHDVDGLVQEAQYDDGGQNGERDRDGDDEGAAPASEEDENHQAGEGRGDDCFSNDAVDGAADEDGLIGEGLNLKFGWKSLGDA